MERNSINVIIFDQDEPSQKDHPSRTTTATSQQAAKGHHLEVIEQELTYLTDRVKQLEQQADSLSQLRHDNSSLCRQSNTSIDFTSAHGQDIALAVEKKIQVVVRQTKKIVDRLGEAFEKKLQSTLAQRQDQSGIAKVKESYKTALRDIEKGYRLEVEKVQREQKEAEKKMLGRVTGFEDRLAQRLQQFEVKEKEYVDWIHHLERQLEQKQQSKNKQQKQLEERQAQEKQLQERKEKESQLRQKQERQLRQKQNQERQLREKQAQQKQNQERQLRERQQQQALEREGSKARRIQMTHVRRDQSENSFMASQHLESASSKQMSSQCNDSKIQRRHKIFEPVGSKVSSSVSPQPQNRSVSPISSLSTALTPTNLGSSKIINPLTKTRPSEHERARDAEVEREKPSLVIQKATQPLKNNFTGEQKPQEHSPWRQMESREKAVTQDELTKRENMVRQVGQDQFYKDVPKPNQGWQHFQNYEEDNSQSDSGSEEDVIFYRNEEKRQSTDWPSERDSKWINAGKSSDAYSSKRQSTFQPGPEQRVFSPFDLN